MTYFPKLDLFAAVFANEGDRIADRRHHSEAEQIDFDEAQLFAIVLVPLNDRAALHRRGLERNDTVETFPRDNHSARMLAEVTRKIERAGVHLHVLCKTPVACRVKA